MRILIVEDEHRIAQAIKEGLEQESYAVDVCYDGEEGYRNASNDEYDLIILDVMMPQMNGYEVVKKLRADGNHTPVLMLTAKDQNNDIVNGLDSGADDYLWRTEYWHYRRTLRRLRGRVLKLCIRQCVVRRR